MRATEFLQFLDTDWNKYEVIDGRIIISRFTGSYGNSMLKSIPYDVTFTSSCEDVYLEAVREFPRGIIFENRGDIGMGAAVTLADDIQIRNSGDIKINYIRNLPAGLEFNNGGNVILPTLEYLTSGVQFNNKGNVSISDLKDFAAGVRFNNKGSINIRMPIISMWPDGISYNRYINLLISQLYER